MAANKKCFMNVFLMDKTTQLYLCTVYTSFFSETIYNLEPNDNLEFFLTYI